MSESRPWVAYFRVSTPRQERSGLGLEAQRARVRRYLELHQGRVLEELTDVESGRSNDRPMFVRALWLCRVYDAKLIIARLDRLSRSAAMIAALMDSKVDFVVEAMPFANRFSLHIFAALAEYECKLTADRIKAALAIAKAQGKKRGGPQRPDFKTYFVGGPQASAINSRKRAIARAEDMKPILCELRDSGETTSGIARRLTAMDIEPPNGGEHWSISTIKRMFELVGQPRPLPYGSKPKPQV